MRKLVAAVILFSPLPAQAALLDGKQVRITREATGLGVIQTWNPTVGAGIEASYGSGAVLIDLSDTMLTITVPGPFGYGPQSFNGFVITDINNVVDPFTSFTLVPGSSPIASNFYSFTANSLTINFSNMSMNNAQYSFAVNGGPADVPEPAMLGLFGLGALGIGLTRRRRAA